MLIVDVDVGVLWVKLRTSELSVRLSLSRCQILQTESGGKRKLQYFETTGN
jgi:hypothetical protein